MRHAAPLLLVAVFIVGCSVSGAGEDRDDNGAAAVSSEGSQDAAGADEDPDESTPKEQDNTRSAEELSQHGVVWRFEEPVHYGRYANGDLWVVGPVTITEIDPPSVTADRVVNGAMINPSPTVPDIGYGHIRANTYDASLNVALDVSPSSPLQVPVGSSLVSTISVEEADARPGIDTAAVLTVVAHPPAPNSFRPPYSGTDKTARFTTDDLLLERLPNLDPVEATPDINEMASRFERVWLDHRGGWTGRKIHPATSMPDYGRDLTARLGEGFLLLMLDFPEAEKHDLLVNLVQIGIDLHGVVEAGGTNNWQPDGGHTQGRKLPILFAGHLLNDPDMAGIGDHDDVYFGEDAQTFYVTQEDIDREVGYDQSHLGLPEWGIRHATDPTMDDPDWDADYRRCCTANSWHGHVLTARILDLQEAWNHDALFDYTTRYMDTELDNDNQNTYHRSWNRPFSENMWDTYHPQF